MAEVLFYHLSSAPLEAALPGLLERALARGWRVVVRCGSEVGMAFLDERLWSYRDDSFLPHGLAGGEAAARQPVLLTMGGGNANAADVLMLTHGARAEPEEAAGFARVCLFFDGSDAAAVGQAREDWRGIVAAGLPAVYWAQEDGRWVQKAASGG